MALTKLLAHLARAHRGQPVGAALHAQARSSERSVASSGSGGGRRGTTSDSGSGALGPLEHHVGSHQRPQTGVPRRSAPPRTWRATSRDRGFRTSLPVAERLEAGGGPCTHQSSSTPTARASACTCRVRRVSWIGALAWTRTVPVDPSSSPSAPATAERSARRLRPRPPARSLATPRRRPRTRRRRRAAPGRCAITAAVSPIGDRGQRRTQAMASARTPTIPRCTRRNRRAAPRANSARAGQAWGGSARARWNSASARPAAYGAHRTVWATRVETALCFDHQPRVAEDLRTVEVADGRVHRGGRRGASRAVAIVEERSDGRPPAVRITGDAQGHGASDVVARGGIVRGGPFEIRARCAEAALALREARLSSIGARCPASSPIPSSPGRARDRGIEVSALPARAGRAGHGASWTCAVRAPDTRTPPGTAARRRPGSPGR